MPLVSFLLRDDKRLQATLVSDPAHVTPGSHGAFVRKIQVALEDLDGITIDPKEVTAKVYGPSTAAAVLAFKKKRAIINPAYQRSADNIVGKMTIAEIDKELVAKQVPPKPSTPRVCTVQSSNNDTPKLRRLV